MTARILQQRDTGRGGIMSAKPVNKATDPSLIPGNLRHARLNSARAALPLSHSGTVTDGFMLIHKQLILEKISVGAKKLPGFQVIPRRAMQRSHARHMR
jgi:hypothetical protein